MHTINTGAHTPYSCWWAKSLNVMSLFARAFGDLSPRAVQCALTTTVGSGKGKEKVRTKGDREGGGVHCGNVGVAGVLVVRNTDSPG